MRGKAYLNIHDGLGNQLFQLAAGYAYAKKNGKQLHVLYKPKPDTYGRCLLVDQLLSEEFRKKILFQSKSDMGIAFRASRKIRRKLFPWTYIEEDVTSHDKDNQLEILSRRGMVELFGFWQDEDFFLPVARELRDNIKINVPLEDQYQQMQEKICNTNSVCIGARLYEDNGRDHTTEAEDSFRVLMQRAECMESVLPEAHFFIFSSSENKILEELCSRRKNMTLARTKDGITETLQTLKIMSHCKHHIFNQSTFYWWAAWLSETIHGVGQCMIIPPERLFCASRSGIPARWIKSAKSLA
ncbi:MAG: hypothetical protein CBB70_08275 [Planctomycetaceae bacterium TMED10]|nr:MAG: hypothetical protein CBB70_08275 [Planctomycetaceae bacterium TMED10]